MSMFSFWVYYGVLMVLWFGFAVYWTVPLIDKYLESLTDGDLKNYLCSKFRNPLLKKVGLMDVVDYKGRSCENGEWKYLFQETSYCFQNRWKAVLVFFMTVLGALFACMIIVIGLHLGDTNHLHNKTVEIATFLSQEATLPIVIIAGALLLHTTLKKVYKFGKKVKPLVDSVNKEEK